LAAAWPRPAQLAAAFLLGAAVALLGVRLWGGGPPRPLDLRHAAVPGHVIDLNRADAAELRQLPGVGPTLAARAVEWRDAGDGFRGLADLRAVPGVGPARLDRVRPWVRVDEPAGPAAAPKKADGLTGPIDVNQANPAELQRLPGIGPTLAQRILEERARAPFAAVDDLRRVKGIGPKTLEKLRPYVTVGTGPGRSAPAD
jgi:competence protein ComEA